jgi:hypothetical protein
MLNNVTRRGFLRSLTAFVTTAAVAPAILLKFPAKPGLRKLHAVWTCESARDLRALHGLGVEKELMAAISKNIVEEMDRELINDLLG